MTNIWTNNWPIIGQLNYLYFSNIIAIFWPIIGLLNYSSILMLFFSSIIIGQYQPFSKTTNNLRFSSPELNLTNNLSADCVSRNGFKKAIILAYLDYCSKPGPPRPATPKKPIILVRLPIIAKKQYHCSFSNNPKKQYYW